MDAWIASDKGFHIMRDHPHHGYPVLGGMWGAKKNTVPNMSTLIDNFAQEDAYGTDYKFFAEAVLPLLDQQTIMIHDEFFGGSPFPTPRKNLEYVGQIVDENEKTIPEHSAALKEKL